MDLKRVAGEAAANRFVESSMIVGLGTGSTAYFAIRKLHERMRKDGLKIRAIPTSKNSEMLAKDLKIPLLEPGDVDRVDVTIDGADEVDDEFRLIKGGGGALLREKMIASISDLEIIVVDPSKVVDKLGVKFDLPVEIVQYGWEITLNMVAGMGCKPKLRKNEGTPFITDNGNYILDCAFPGIHNPEKVEKDLNAIPGVVENGLFIGLAHKLVIGTKDGAVIRDK